MSLEFKDFRVTEFQVKAEDGGAMTIEGYGSTFGGSPDSYDDIVAPGAFAESLKVRQPKMLYQHDTDRICGKWLKASEDSKGLFLKGMFLESTLGKDTYIEVKSGALDTMSIGFSTVNATRDEATGIRTLSQVNLYEVSLVTFPANENAQVTGCKAAPATLRAFEKYLREGGFSHEDAVSIAKHGFNAITDRREADPELVRIFETFKSISNPIHS